MSKTLKLTRSRNQHGVRLPNMACIDALNNCCGRLRMLAELMQACGNPLEPEIVKEIGYWLGQEAKDINVLAKKLEREDG